ncbi:YceI family protein [Vaginella massiliensis]|uniref:YceI family protein n=1 Tax=Vaginella massiliensis TaxID=1816680 RepID=UPI000837F5E4|nr:YceI family protein [Vaginella massiliensis]
MSTKWTIDKTKSTVFFTIESAAIGEVKGHFTNFHGDIVAEDQQFNRADFTFAIEVNSLVTGIEERDQHLLSEDFFDVKNFPQIIFISEREGIESNELMGKLEIKGVKKDTTFVTNLEELDDAHNLLKLQCEVNRKEFGLTWENPDTTNSIAESVLLTAELHCIKNSD